MDHFSTLKGISASRRRPELHPQGDPTMRPYRLSHSSASRTAGHHHPAAGRARLLAVCLLATALVAGTLASLPAAAEVPPQNLHQEPDGHWTAWYPPVPPPDAEVHVVVRGDTLWDLAAQFFGDPYLWPQIWEQNQYIADAHWIYPGDPLVVGLQLEMVDDLAALTDPFDDGAIEDDDGILSAAEARNGPVPLGGESDIYCTGYIAETDREFPFAIIGSEYESLVPELEVGRFGGPKTLYGTQTLRYGLMTGDIIYLDGGAEAGMSAGDLFTVVGPEELIRHPVQGNLLGRYYRYEGRVRVLSAQRDTAIAEIVHACDPVTVGSKLEPFRAMPVPLGRPGVMRPVNYPTAAENLINAPVIVRAEDDILTLGEDSLVYLDQGELQDVVPGDIYTIYRANDRGLPPVVMGELAVLAVYETSSVARILRSRYTVRIGDRLEIK